MKLGQNERFSITSSNTITPFWEKWGDEVTGHFVDIGIEEFYDFNSCAIPLSSAIPSPTNPCKDARILINSVIYGNAPSDTNFNVVVKDQLGALVGSLIGGEWIVNTGGGSCPDANYTIEDSLGNILYTGTIPSGGSLTQAISNSTLNVNKSDGTLISSRSILAQGTSSYNVADSSAVLKDESGNVLSTTGIKATESKDIVAPNGDVSVNSVAFDDVLSGGTLNIEVRKSTGNDLIGSKQGQYWRIGDSTAVIKDSANNTLKSQAIMATETENIVINDSVAVIKNSVGTTLKSENILAEATENITINNSSVENSDATYSVDVLAEGSLTLPDSQINVNSLDSGDVVSVKTIDVNLEDSLGVPVTPTSVGLVGNTLTIEVPSSAPPSTGTYLVRFFDIDGTILKEERRNAGQDATAPTDPDYDPTYLTFAEWNQPFTNVQNDIDVGAIYDTIDGKTYLFLRITDTTGLQPTLQLRKATTDLMTINWGDATTNTTSVNGNFTVTKTAAYSAIGDYIVTIECAGLYSTNNSTGYLLGNNTTYSSSLLKLYMGVNMRFEGTPLANHRSLKIISVGKNASIPNTAFTTCVSLTHINISKATTSIQGAFVACNSLKSISIPQTITSITDQPFTNCFALQKLILTSVTSSTLTAFGFENCFSLEKVILNNTLPNISNGGQFSNCRSLKSINIPNSFTAIPNIFFGGCISLTELEFPNSITNIGSNQTFAGCTSILEYTFLSVTPPTNGDTSTFSGINAACKIYVPDASVAAYKAATNWTVVANYIYPLSTKP
jgi:hypothetical protein